MLTIAWPWATVATIQIVIVITAVMLPLDCPNNRADRPIPTAYFTWKVAVVVSRHVFILFTVS